MARGCGWEVRVACFVDAHRGQVPVSRVNAGFVGAGLVGRVGLCGGRSCCERCEAQLVRGFLHGTLGGCWCTCLIVVDGSGV